MVLCISDHIQMVFKPYPILTVASIASLVVLVILGNWQWEKYSKKSNNIVTVTETALKGSAVVVESPKGGYALQVYGLIEGNSVWRRYVPGRINGVGDPVFFSYDATLGPVQEPLQIFGLGTIRTKGISNVFVRNDRPGFFTPRNDPVQNTWYWFDSVKMISLYGFSVKKPVRVVEQEFIDVKDVADTQNYRTVKNPYFTNERTDTLPRERHFGYALSWWGMALALFIIYCVYHVQQGRLRTKL